MAANHRRTFLRLSLSASTFLLVACATEQKKPRTPIPVEVSNVTDVPSLIASIKKAGGRSVSNSIRDEDFFDELARVFVDNVHAAAENGYPIPRWILDQLPRRRVVVPILGYVVLTLWGTQFIIPTATVITAVLGSITLMTTAVFQAIRASLAVSSSKI